MAQRALFQVYAYDFHKLQLAVVRRPIEITQGSCSTGSFLLTNCFSKAKVLKILATKHKIVQTSNKSKLGTTHVPKL